MHTACGYLGMHFVFVLPPFFAVLKAVKEFGAVLIVFLLDFLPRKTMNTTESPKALFIFGTRGGMATRISSPQGNCSDHEIDHFYFEYSTILYHCSSDHLRGVGGGAALLSEEHKHRPRMSLPPLVILSFSLLHLGLVKKIVLNVKPYPYI